MVSGVSVTVAEVFTVKLAASFVVAVAVADDMDNGEVVGVVDDVDDEEKVSGAGESTNGVVAVVAAGGEVAVVAIDGDRPNVTGRLPVIGVNATGVGVAAADRGDGGGNIIGDDDEPLGVL